MKRLLITASIVLFVIALSASSAIAELAKEGSGKYRSGRSAQISFLKMGEKYMQINFDETGIVVDAPANSPFVNASFNTMERFSQLMANLRTAVPPCGHARTAKRFMASSREKANWE